MNDTRQSSTAEERKTRNRIIVDYEEQKKYRKGVALFVFKILVVFAFALLVLFRYASVTEIGHKINLKQKEYDALTEENRKLNKELAGYTNIETLKQIAEERFNMSLPTAEQKVYIEPAECDRTELYNIGLTEDKKETKQESFKEKIRHFVGIL